MLAIEGALHKNILVVKVLALKKPTKQRVVKGFGQLRLRVHLQKVTVLLFYILPETSRSTRIRQLLFELLQGFINPLIIKRNAL